MNIKIDINWFSKAMDIKLGIRRIYVAPEKANRNGQTERQTDQRVDG